MGCNSEIAFLSVKPMPRGSGSSMESVVRTISSTAAEDGAPADLLPRRARPAPEEDPRRIVAGREAWTHGAEGESPKSP